MTGPLEWSDNNRVWFEWTCPKCGHRCERFRFEMPGEQPKDPNIRSLAEYYSDKSYLR